MILGTEKIGRNIGPDAKILMANSGLDGLTIASPSDTNPGYRERPILQKEKERLILAKENQPGSAEKTQAKKSDIEAAEELTEVSGQETAEDLPYRSPEKGMNKRQQRMKKQ